MICASQPVACGPQDADLLDAQTQEPQSESTQEESAVLPGGPFHAGQIWQFRDHHEQIAKFVVVRVAGSDYCRSVVLVAPRPPERSSGGYYPMFLWVPLDPLAATSKQLIGFADPPQPLDPTWEHPPKFSSEDECMFFGSTLREWLDTVEKIHYLD